MCEASFPPHILYPVIIPQPQEPAVPQVSILSPFHKLELPHQHRLRQQCRMPEYAAQSVEKVREHLRQQRGRHRIQEQDSPTRTPLSTQQLLSRAEKAGAHIGALCQAMYRNLGEQAVRRILGVLNLVKRYGAASTDEACAMGLETGASHYHFVRRYLERNPQLPLSLRQVDPLIRQLELYRDLIESRTQNPKQENPS
jgi:hypothetical protein